MAGEPDRNAFLLASEAGKALLPEDTLVERIAGELTAIHKAVPAVKKLNPIRPWIPGEIMLGLEKGGKAKLARGELKEISAANQKYGPVQQKQFRSLEVVSLIFDQPYNADRLVKVYSRLAGVKYVEVNRVVGDGDRVERKVKGGGIVHYTFSKGWGDCQAGCIHRHFWEVEVRDGMAKLLKEHGDPLP